MSEAYQNLDTAAARRHWGPARAATRTRAQLLVVDRDLAVEHERAGRQLHDGGGQISEAPRVVAAVAADQADAVAVLVRQHPPAVDLLLVDPAVAVERLACFP
jgi:hypothetical protein